MNDIRLIIMCEGKELKKISGSAYGWGNPFKDIPPNIGDIINLGSTNFGNSEDILIGTRYVVIAKEFRASETQDYCYTNKTCTITVTELKTEKWPQYLKELPHSFKKSGTLLFLDEYMKLIIVCDDKIIEKVSGISNRWRNPFDGIMPEIGSVIDIGSTCFTNYSDIAIGVRYKVISREFIASEAEYKCYTNQHCIISVIKLKENTEPSKGICKLRGLDCNGRWIENSVGQMNIVTFDSDNRANINYLANKWCNEASKHLAGLTQYFRNGIVTVQLQLIDMEDKILDVITYERQITGSLEIGAEIYKVLTNIKEYEDTKSMDIF